MNNDIIPPERLNSLKRPAHGMMPSLRLRGHTPQDAQARLDRDRPADQLLRSVASSLGDRPASPSSSDPPDKVRQKWYRRRKIWLLAATVVMVSATALLAWLLVLRADPAPPAQVAAKPKAPAPPPQPTIVPSPLTGLGVPPESAKRPVTGIMIENSPDARPQSGLRDAGIVFEAVAEGGITRFLALYQEAQPSYVGPVRSLRPYYLDWLAPFDAAVAHVGGSRDALDQVRSGMKDLDQFINGSSFWRINERYAPHNVYTSFEKLNALNQSKGYTSSNFLPWPRKKETKPSTAPAARGIDIKISGFLYNPHYDYDPVTNSYLRSQGGKSHVDILGQDDKVGKQLAPKVIIVLAMNYSYGPANDGTRSSYATTGGGKLWVFQDGAVLEGSWEKAGRQTNFSFKNAAGQPIAFNPGQTWVSIVSTTTSVSYVP